MNDFSIEKIFDMREKEIYYVSNNVSKYYKKSFIPKKNGKIRTLYIPDEKLKYMQRVILNEFLLEYKISKMCNSIS
ncbi:MAG: hypothetical protein NC213_08085 [Acetobacter sp.]|nr:hypothetical protein [Bacteroides sp.]MCM1341688.1 hypothetical protein [Acetobacter sp.]MCM1432374.1 hypothetical protein [Clostridiales bacterium]